MALASLEIWDFRCIKHAQLEFDDRCTGIVGENAAGKTSILEAIQLLSSGRSFRTSRTEHLLPDSGASHFRVAGRVKRGEALLSVGVQWGRSGRDVRINGVANSSFAQLATVLPVQVIDPSSHRLLEGGPIQRRRFIDWGVFHVEPTFVDAWRNYQKALLQRNAALKAQSSPELIRSWDQEFLRSGEIVADQRRRYVDDIKPTIQRYCAELTGVDVNVTHQQGWESATNLDIALRKAWTKDLRYRTTSLGPHRADLELQVNQANAKDRISRGQQKLLACALLLAQLQHRNQIGLDPACLLLDDPAAELDVNNLGKLLRLIGSIPAQLIVTAVDANSIGTILPAKKFHVKQGCVSPML